MHVAQHGGGDRGVLSSLILVAIRTRLVQVPSAQSGRQANSVKYRAVLGEPDEKPRDDREQTTVAPDGSRSTYFNTVEGLTAAVAAAGGVGFGGMVRVGGQP